MNRYQALLNELCSGCVLGNCDKTICDLYLGFEELVERATPKKPIKHDKPDPKYRTLYSCPKCGVIYLSLHGDYCFHCGQALKWGEEDGKDN